MIGRHGTLWSLASCPLAEQWAFPLSPPSIRSCLNGDRVMRGGLRGKSTAPSRAASRESATSSGHGSVPASAVAASSAEAFASMSPFTSRWRGR